MLATRQIPRRRALAAFVLACALVAIAAAESSLAASPNPKETLGGLRHGAAGVQTLVQGDSDTPCLGAGAPARCDPQP